MPTRDDIALLAEYNASMNRKVYAAAATLPHEVLAEDRGAFFGSVLGTLNHILCGDRIWLGRFAGHPAGFAALRDIAATPAPTGLRHSYGGDLGTLLALHQRLDDIVTALAAEVSNEELQQPLSYTNSQGPQCKNFGALLLHFFNHQTHHRGQASTLLSQSGADIGVTDLLELIPDSR